MHRLRFGSTLAILCLLTVSVTAAELTVEDFVAVTIARLELAETTWGEEDRSPTTTEEDNLFEDYGTIAERYYQFAGKNQQAIESYLDDQPDLRNTIETLSNHVRQLIEQGEVN